MASKRAMDRYMNKTFNKKETNIAQVGDEPLVLPNLSGVNKFLDERAYGLWRTNGTSIYYNGGKVGIGTISPSIDLEVQSASGAGGIIVSQNGGSGSTKMLVDASSDGIIQLYNDTGGYAVQIHAASNSFFNGGKVGIGTASPRTFLHVLNDGVNDGFIPALGDSDDSTSFMVSNNDNKYGLLMGTLATGVSWLQAQRADGTATAYNLLLEPNGGNVGIGTTTPDEKFSVVDKMLVTSAGLTYWKDDASGIPFGSMYTNSTIAVTISDSNPTEVGDTWTTGEVLNMTFGSSHYLVATKAGRYKIDWSMSIAQNSPSAQIELEGGIMVNNSAVNPGRVHRTVANSTDIGAMGSTAILDLAANDQISLYVANETNTTNIDVEHANVTAVMVGGT